LDYCFAFDRVKQLEEESERYAGIVAIHSRAEESLKSEVEALQVSLLAVKAAQENSGQEGHSMVSEKTSTHEWWSYVWHEMGRLHRADTDRDRDRDSDKDKARTVPDWAFDEDCERAQQLERHQDSLRSQAIEIASLRQVCPRLDVLTYQ
jgi:hypothetical protein